MRRLPTALALIGILCGQSLAADAKHPNIIFILADGLGWTDLGVQEAEYYETPNIDRLASQECG